MEEEQTNEIVKSDYCALPAVSWGCTTMQCGMQSFSDDKKTERINMLVERECEGDAVEIECIKLQREI